MDCRASPRRSVSRLSYRLFDASRQGVHRNCRSEVIPSRPSADGGDEAAGGRRGRASGWTIARVGGCSRRWGRRWSHLWDEVTSTEAIDLETAEATVRDGMLAIGARWLAAAVAIQGTGKTGTHRRCACGGQAVCEGYRAKQVQTVVGWITMRRAYDRCSACGHGHGPLEAALGVARDRLSPGVRRLAGRVGARLPFAEAADSLGEAARVRLSARTVRTVTEAVGARREQNWRPPSPRPGRRGCLPLPVPATGATVCHSWMACASSAPTGADARSRSGSCSPCARAAGREQREAASYVAG